MVIPRAKFPLCSGDLFDSDDFVAADLQIRPSCATILSDVQPPIIVPKKLPVTGGNLYAINQAIDAVSGFARAVSLLACVSAALRFIHVSQNENSLRISVHSYLEIVCRTSNAAHNKEGVSYA